MSVTVAQKPQLHYAAQPRGGAAPGESPVRTVPPAGRGGAGSVLLLRIREQLAALEWQRRCMAGPVPQGTVVVFEYSKWSWMSSGVPDAWRKLYASVSPPGLKSTATVFLRDMPTPTGKKRRLVAVDIDPPQRPPFGGRFVLTVSARGSSVRARVRFCLSSPRPPRTPCR